MKGFEMKDVILKKKVEKLRIELMMNLVQHKIFKEQNIPNGCCKKICRYQRLLKKLKEEYELLSNDN